MTPTEVNALIGVVGVWIGIAIAYFGGSAVVLMWDKAPDRVQVWLLVAMWCFLISIIGAIIGIGVLS